MSLVTASTGSAICAYLFLILVGYHFWILFKYVRDKGIYLGAAGSTLGILIGDVLVVVLGFAFVYMGVGVQETLAEGCSHAFRDCLYFSIVSFSTLGYGDFQPIPDIRILAATEGLFGYLLLGLLVGLLASSASSKISRSSNLRKSESQYPSSDEDDFTL